MLRKRRFAASVLLELAEDEIQTPQAVAERERVVRRRKRRHRRSELTRLSASRKFYIANNAGLARSNNKFMSMEKVAQKFKLKSPNPVVVLSKYFKAKGVDLRALQNAGRDVQEGRIGPREDADGMDELTPVRRSGRVGNCGRKPLSDEQKDQRARLSQAVLNVSVRHVYEDVHAGVTEEISRTPIGHKISVANALIARKFEPLGLKSPTAKHLVRCAATQPGEHPRPQGGAFWTREEEILVRKFVTELPARKLYVSSDLVLVYADSLVPKTDARHLQLGENGFARGVWPGLAERVGVKVGTAQNLDTIRARWVTAANFRRWYDKIYRDFVEEKVAEPHPDFDPSDPRKHPRLRWLRPQAIMSGDETDMSLGSEPKQSKNERGVFLDSEIDNRDIASTTSSKKISWLYRRCGSGKMLPPLIVYGGAVKNKPEWCSNDVLSDVHDEDGEIIPTVWHSNLAGSVDADFFKEYVQRIIIPAAKGSGVRDETGHRGYYFLDGCQTHLADPATTRLLKDAGVKLFLRALNTSSVSQGEDTVVFPVRTRFSYVVFISPIRFAVS